MKKTVNANIGGSPFILEEDAYATLESYLNQISSCLKGGESAEETEEILSDIEIRIADLFQGNLSSRMQAVSLAVVNRTIAIIGPTSEFGTPAAEKQQAAPPVQGQNTTPPAMDTSAPETAKAPWLRNPLPERLFRSRTQKVLGGVCGGLAEYYRADPSIVRVIALALLVLSGGSAAILYFVLWVLLPRSPELLNS